VKVELRAGDFRALAAQLPQADVVLLDAPCLGTGTLRRRPDAKWRKTPEQLAELVQLQRELLDAAARCVRVGGHLVYSTCSLEREENAEQVLGWLQHNPGWQIAPPERLAEAARPALVTAEGFLQSWPQRDGCDGMFAAKLRKAGKR
jgi:16S rRNA (cytosine967-C5)-methyltransferase